MNAQNAGRAVIRRQKQTPDEKNGTCEEAHFLLLRTQCKWTPTCQGPGRAKERSRPILHRGDSFRNTGKSGRGLTGGFVPPLLTLVKGMNRKIRRNRIGPSFDNETQLIGTSSCWDRTELLPETSETFQKPAIYWAREIPNIFKSRKGVGHVCQPQSIQWNKF